MQREVSLLSVSRHNKDTTRAQETQITFSPKKKTNQQ